MCTVASLSTCLDEQLAGLNSPGGLRELPERYTEREATQ